MPHTLLLADDSVTIRRVIELTFADEDVTVVSVSSGREAMAGIEASRPDIVLADAGMPDVSGYEIAAFVKGRPDLRHIPVVLLAGAFEPLDEARARQAGSDGVLVKPFEPQMAVARVRELLARRTPVPSFAPPRLTDTSETELEPLHVPDPAFDESLDRLDEAFASGATQAAPALDPSTASEFANDLRELRSARVDSGGFERQDFGDWDLPKPASGAAPSPADDYLDSLSAQGPLLPPPVALPPIRAVSPPPAAPAPIAAPAPAPAPPPALASVSVNVPPQPAAAVSAPAPLADAFSSLLAAEEGRSHAPLPAVFGAQPGGPLTNQQMDAIVDRLIDRLGPDVRVAVIDLAERLVKAEIDRLKALR